MRRVKQEEVAVEYSRMQVARWRVLMARLRMHWIHQRIGAYITTNHEARKHFAVASVHALQVRNGAIPSHRPPLFGPLIDWVLTTYAGYANGNGSGVSVAVSGSASVFRFSQPPPVDSTPFGTTQCRER